MTDFCAGEAPGPVGGKLPRPAFVRFEKVEPLASSGVGPEPQAAH